MIILVVDHPPIHEYLHILALHSGVNKTEFINPYKYRDLYGGTSPSIPIRPAPTIIPPILITDIMPFHRYRRNDSSRSYWRKGRSYTYGNEYAASVNRIIGELAAKFKFASITNTVKAFTRHVIFGNSRINKVGQMNLLILKQL